MYNARLEPERALEPLERAVELAAGAGAPRRAPGRSAPSAARRSSRPARRGGDRARAGAGTVRRERGRPDARADDELARHGRLAATRPATAEEILREAIRVLKPLRGSRHARREPAAARPGAARQGRIDDAERLALEARETVGAHDSLRLDDAASPRARPGRPGAGRGGGAPAPGGHEILRPTGFCRHRIAPLEALAAFLALARARRRGRRGRGVVG